MKLSNKSKELLGFASLIALVTLAFLFVLFGITGLRVGLGIIFVSLPFYFILNPFNFLEGEKLVFSLLLGLTLFPSLAYLIGFVVSFKIAIILAFVIFMIIAAITNMHKNKIAKK